LKLYGSKVFVRVPETKRESKWDRKADTGILIGYERNGYKVLVEGKIVKSRHVEIIEDRESLIDLEKSDENENESEENLDRNSVNSDIIDNENANAQNELCEQKRNTLNVNERLSVCSNQSDGNETGVRRSERERKNRIGMANL